MKRNGFTLIEFLIVIGILAALAAIIFPIFAAVRERGRRTVCLSNERQMGVAMLQYVADEGEVFPSGYNTPGDKWVTGTYPYVRNITVYQCPDSGGPYGLSPSPSTGFPVGYGLNYNLGVVQGVNAGEVLPAKGFGLSALTAPAKTVLFFEVESGAMVATDFNGLDNSTTGNAGDTGSAESDGKGHGGTLTDATYPTTGGIYGVATYATGNVGGRLLNGATKDGRILNPRGSTPRHAGGSNYVACDGHALWLRPEAVSGGRDAVAADCSQGTFSGQPKDCVEQTEDRAAGVNSNFILTFSIR